MENKTNQALYQTENIQFQCQGSVTLWIRNMVKYTEDTKKNTDIHQEIHVQTPTPEVVRHGNQHYTLEMDQTTSNST